MCAVQLLRVSVLERISAAAEDFLLQVAKGEEAAEIPVLRAMLAERLTAAAEEIVALFEETVAEYEERVERSEREICRQRRLLDTVLKPEVRLHRADVQQLNEEEVPPEQQDWGPSLDQHPAEPPHIKEEQEELWTSQEGEQLQGLEEADVTRCPFTPVPVKSEDDEEEPQSSQIHQSHVDKNRDSEEGEDCGEPEPARNPGPDRLLEPVSEDNSLDSNQTDDSDCDWTQTNEAPPGMDIVDNSEGPDVGPSVKERPFPCSYCGKRFSLKGNLNRHIRDHTGERPFPCTGCDKSFKDSGSLTAHMRCHTGEQPYSCLFCGKNFSGRGNMTRHMRIHTGEKPFTCSTCNKSFHVKEHLNRHMKYHTGEKPFSCSVCGKGCAQKTDLKKHMRVHTGEKPFSCPFCGKCCAEKGDLTKHMRVHTGEKPFSCNICGKSCAQKGSLKIHMRIHTGEKPFSCSVCSKRFTVTGHLKRHMKLHTAEGLPSDVRKVIIGEEDHQDWGPSLDQDLAELPHIKEEQEELWTSQEGEQLQGLEEADVTRFPFTPIPVKSEDDEEEPQSSWLHQSHAEGNRDSEGGEDCGGPEPARNPGPHRFVEPDLKASESSETDVSDGDWEETREPQSGLNSLKPSEVHGADFTCSTVERSFSCPECGQRFGRKPHLSAHMRIHTGEKPFSCSFCGKRFSQKGNSVSHMRLHTGEKPFSCSLCKKQFRYSGDVSRHMRIHTGKKTTSRRDSDTASSSKRTRSGPAKSLSSGRGLPPGTDDKPQEPETKASTDGWKEAREPQLDLNTAEHDVVTVSDIGCSYDKESYSCSECGKTFCRKDHLMTHMRTHTGEKPFSCSVCQKRFSCSGNILAHMRIHTGEKPFECSFCGKGFSQKGTMQLHMRIHTGEKPFSCPFCDKRFAHKRRMTLHMSVHTEEKRFCCRVCDKRFTWYTQLKTHKCVGESSHLQSHAEKKATPKESFSCTECGKKFSLKGNLKTHMRIHTGEKPFSCLVCGKSFKQNVHLTEHMTIHTGEKLYKCSVCGKGFNKKLLVKNHTCV